ncbi:MAG: SAM-dependent methyltransferase [Candidatus Pelagibacter sp.]|nr:SAM-dependent methyltransferase [Candidatus Pelagibacter sp.]
MSGSFLLSERLEKYIYEFGVNETEVEKELRLYSLVEHSTTSHLQISPDQSEFLKIIIKLGNYKNILELGTYLGYSTLGMALTTSGTITTIDKDDRFIKKAYIFWEKSNVSHKIKFIRGMAIDEIEKLPLNSFDMIFIDADKTNNIKYYEKCKSLLSSEGILIFDNVLWKGKVSENTKDPKVLKIKEFNNYVKNDNYFEISLISIGDGMMLCKKKNLK